MADYTEQCKCKDKKTNEQTFHDFKGMGTPAKQTFPVFNANGVSM